MDDIALPQDSNDAALSVGDHSSANIRRHQNFGGLGQGPMRLGGDDVSSLGRENACNSHLCLPEHFPDCISTVHGAFLQTAMLGHGIEKAGNFFKDML